MCLRFDQFRQLVQLRSDRRQQIVQRDDSHERTIPVCHRRPAHGSSSAKANGSSKTYVVKKGETLGAIAHKLGCGSVGELAGPNRIKGPSYAVKPGQTLQVSCGKR